jgi:hypothetical protein
LRAQLEAIDSFKRVSSKLVPLIKGSRRSTSKSKAARKNFSRSVDESKKVGVYCRASLIVASQCKQELKGCSAKRCGQAS